MRAPRACRVRTARAHSGPPAVATGRPPRSTACSAGSYVATGNGYADPPQLTTDAVLALDINTGELKWSQQMTQGDDWVLGCQQSKGGNSACPKTLGPDFGLSAPPALAKRVNDRDLLVLPQKSGILWALDPDKAGRVVWQYRIGQGSGLGGQWGVAVEGDHAYVCRVADLYGAHPEAECAP